MFLLFRFRVRLLWIIFHIVDGTPSMAQQVKSRKRVQEHGEVFTNEREVNAMLDMVKQETERIESRFLRTGLRQRELPGRSAKTEARRGRAAIQEEP